MEYEKPKFGTKKWFENYWYHNKWPTIFGIFIFMLIVLFIKDMAFKEKYDDEVSITCVTPVNFEQMEYFSLFLSQYGFDHDGNGTVNVGVMVNQYPEGENPNPQLVMAAQTKFMVELAEGTSMILIMDDPIYEKVGDPSAFADLSGFSSKAYDDGRKIRLSDTPMASDPVLSPLCDNLFITMRAPDVKAVTKNDKSQQSYENAKKLLENLLNDNKTGAIQPEVQ